MILQLKFMKIPIIKYFCFLCRTLRLVVLILLYYMLNVFSILPCTQNAVSLSLQPAPAWTTFRVGLFCGIFIVLNITLVLAGE